MTYQNALIGHGELFWAQQSWVIGGITDDARNTIVQQAIDGDYDFVFFMDSDMVFPKGTLARMLRNLAKIPENELPVLGGMYNTRGDHRMNIYNWIEEENAFKPIYHDLDSGIHAVDAIATGCLLLDTSVFKEIEFPWFEYKYWHGPLKKKLERWSEDMVFAYKCMEKGIKHYVDTSIVCKHLHHVGIVQTDKENYQIEKLSGEVYA